MALIKRKASEFKSAKSTLTAGLRVVLTFICSLIIVVCVPIATVLTGINAVAFDDHFYLTRFERYESHLTTGMSRQQLMEVSSAIIQYLSGQRSDLVVPATVNGVRKDSLFNERELAHMNDVKNLFILGNRIRLASLIMAVVGIAAIVGIRGLREGLKEVIVAFRWAALVPILLLVLAGVLLRHDFDQWFTSFHLALFSNDLWMLNPDTDMLINMFNEGFFYDAGIRILEYSGLFLLALGALSFFGLKLLGEKRSWWSG